MTSAAEARALRKRRRELSSCNDNDNPLISNNICNDNPLISNNELSSHLISNHNDNYHEYT